MTLNSSKLSRPSPFKSKWPIIAVHCSMDFDSPNLPSIFCKLLGVINPNISESWYISKASAKSFNFSSSPAASIIFTKSSKLKNPSPSESNSSINFSASLNNNTPPIMPSRFLSSDGEILPSPSSSKYLRTRSNSVFTLITEEN
uniref:Uncharacterized protein n=1 Tax=Glycine max TaxID=3847 RepID=C6T2A8_SOYBN|nr:unknown [Glycine max]